MAFKGHNIPFVISGDGIVLADEALTSVFENIVRNAISHGKTEKMEVAINKKGENYEIRFIDFGSGVPDEIKEKIFEEGYKSAESKGSGLGLFIVKQVVARYNGEIFVEDNIPTGVVFVIELPII